MCKIKIPPPSPLWSRRRVRPGRASWRHFQLVTGVARRPVRHIWRSGGVRGAPLAGAPVLIWPRPNRRRCAGLITQRVCRAATDYRRPARPGQPTPDNSGHQTVDIGHRTVDNRHRTVDTSDTRQWTPNTGQPTPDIGHRASDT